MSRQCLVAGKLVMRAAQDMAPTLANAPADRMEQMPVVEKGTGLIGFIKYRLFALARCQESLQ